MQRCVALGLLVLVGGWDFHDCNDTWSQWGQSPAHDGQVGALAQDPTRELAHLLIDPFVAQEQAESGRGDLLAHYQVPLVDDDGRVFMLTKTGKFTSCDPPGSGQPFPCGVAAWSTQIWTEK